MAVRNFYFVADVDGRKEPSTGGPGAKEGGLQMRLFQRNKGMPEIIAFIDCQAVDGGKQLRTTIRNFDGKVVFTCETER